MFYFFIYKELGPGPNSQSCFFVQDFQSWRLLGCYLRVWLIISLGDNGAKTVIHVQIFYFDRNHKHTDLSLDKSYFR